jgi:hypothetical protein
VPETPEQLWQRTHGALRTPPVEEWETWPFAGPATPRALVPPVDAEAPRHGTGGVDCRTCKRGDEGAIWADENWFLHSHAPTGLPLVAVLFTRRHVDFPDLLQAALGPLLVRIQRAVASIPDVGNVHVCRWGDGSEHCHIWFMARPARLPQLAGSFAAIWDDMLPPLPDETWLANVAIVEHALTE